MIPASLSSVLDAAAIILDVYGAPPSIAKTTANTAGRVPVHMRMILLTLSLNKKSGMTDKFRKLYFEVVVISSLLLCGTVCFLFHFVRGIHGETQAAYATERRLSPSNLYAHALQIPPQVPRKEVSFAK